MLHRLELHVGLRVATCSTAELTQLVVLIKVKLGALKILVHILTEHLFEVTFALVASTLRGVHFTGAQFVQVSVTVLRFLPSLTLISKLRSVKGITTHKLVALDSGWAGSGSTR